MKKFTSIFAMILLIFCFGSCEQNVNEELNDPQENSSSDKLYQYILDLGFDASSVEDRKDSFLVEETIVFSKANFNPEPITSENIQKRSSLVTLLRYYNPFIRDHLYVTRPTSLAGYRYERNEGRVYTSATSGTVPLYKYYSSRDRDHFYTTNFSELGNGASGYKFQGITGFVFNRGAGGRVALYRYYSRRDRDHFYTTNFSELGGGGRGYVYEGVQCYVSR